MIAWALLACSPVSDLTLLDAPDAARDGADGADGPWGAGLVSLRVQARVTDVVPVSVVFPSDEDAAPAVDDAPVVVLIHGGFVSPDRYLWLARHFATRGYVSVLPQAELLLAITQPGNGELALDALREEADGDGVLAGLVAPDGPTAAMGHSLGGVMAARQWVRDEDMDLLAMLASFPAGSDPIEEQVGRPVLSVVGTTDQGLPGIEEAFPRYPGPSAQWILDGVNHYAWTDDPKDSELARDGELLRPLDEARRDALRIVDATLDVYLLGDDPSRLDGPFPGTVSP
ncbi:MAG: alpha/beta fold hydrolase [Myxococcales bacterium]|nr:alpha/beta fold hydrolase [Myxococcales bacterium]